MRSPSVGLGPRPAPEEHLAELVRRPRAARARRSSSAARAGKDVRRQDLPAALARPDQPPGVEEGQRPVHDRAGQALGDFQRAAGVCAFLLQQREVDPRHHRLGDVALVVDDERGSREVGVRVGRQALPGARVVVLRPGPRGRPEAIGSPSSSGRRCGGFPTLTVVRHLRALRLPQPFARVCPVGYDRPRAPSRRSPRRATARRARRPRDNVPPPPGDVAHISVSPDWPACAARPGRWALASPVTYCCCP